MDDKTVSTEPAPAQVTENDMPRINWSRSAIFLVLIAAIAYGQVEKRSEPSYSAQYVFVNPTAYTVQGSTAAFRQSAFTTNFNPTNTSPPFFQIFDDSFLHLLGNHATMRLVAQNSTFSFAHEAPIWVPETDEMFFASNDGGALGMSDLNHNSQVSKISLEAVKEAVASSNGSEVNVPYTKVDLADTVQMTNGGTGLYKGNLLLVTSGRGDLPPSIVLVNPKPPYNDTVILDNFFGRQFNSLNDVKVHPSGNIFFTDTTYAWLYSFRPAPLLPAQVYRFDPRTGSVRVVADGYTRCNGVALSGDGKTAYVTDTGVGGGTLLGNNQTLPSTIYAYDIDKNTQSFANRRVFAYTDAGVPDGIQVDKAGNVYAGCADGIHVWNSQGNLIGKFFVGSTSANMAFAGPGKLVIMSETKIFYVEFAGEGLDLTYQ